MTACFVPHILISSAHSKVMRLCWVDEDGIQPYFFITLLYNHQFTVTQTADIKESVSLAVAGRTLEKARQSLAQESWQRGIVEKWTSTNTG